MDCRGITFAELDNAQRLELGRHVVKALPYTGTTILNLSNTDILLPHRKAIIQTENPKNGTVTFEMVYSDMLRGESWIRYECLPDDIEVTVRNDAYKSSWHPKIDAYTVEFRPNNDIWIDTSFSNLDESAITQRMYDASIWIARDEAHARVLRNAHPSTRDGVKITIVFPYEQVCDSEDGGIAFGFLRTR